MRTLAAVAASVLAFAVPTFGVIDVSLRSGGSSSITVAPDSVFTVDVLAKATSGLFGLAGDVFASGASGRLQAQPGTFAWVPSFSLNLGGSIVPALGSPSLDGGWTRFGAARTNIYENYNDPYNAAALGVVASYQVRVLDGAQPGEVVLSFHPIASSSTGYGGWVCSENDYTHTVTIGTLTSLTVTVIPEPATLGLLALGGFLLVRRHRA